MPKIVISYRRRDSEAMTGRIFDRLVAHYGRDAVFQDIDNIPPGIDFRTHITDALNQSEILLAIVGRNWVGRSGRAGRARIDDDDDLVRIEVEIALRRGIPIIPVLPGHTRMPSADRVPESLKEFVYRQAVRVDPGRDFEHHIDRLRHEIDGILDSGLEVAAVEPHIEVPRQTLPDMPAARMSSAASSSPAAPRLSIVVLPFANLSDDREHQYFADGITEDVTTDLSRVAGMFVISRNTAFTDRDKSIDTKQIGRELGVRYVLEGAVRRSDNQVRVNAQLIDAETDAYRWAGRFNGDTSDLFGLQDEITSRIAVELNLELVSAEAARPTEHPDALDYILRGRFVAARPPSRDKYAEAIGLFEQALALDPQSIEAQSRLVSALTGRVMDQMSGSIATDIARAEGLVQRALAASPRNPLAHFAKGQILRVQKRYAEAIPEYEMAIAFDRNWVNAFGPLGECKFLSGEIDQMIPLHEYAIRLSPRDPYIAVWYIRIAIAHLVQTRIDDAIAWLEKARAAQAGLPYAHAYLASAYALRDETRRAAVELAEARRLSGDGRYSSIAALKAAGTFGVPKVRALFEATHFAGLRKAGMPEELWPQPADWPRSWRLMSRVTSG